MTKEKGATSLSRREFLKGAAIAGAATAGAAALSGCGGQVAESKPVWMPDAWDAETDILVVGCGGAGISAGIAVASEGLGDCLILEAAPEGEEGGNTRVSAQVIFCPDSVEGAIKYQTNLNGPYYVEEDLMRAWAENLCENVDWLNSIGILAEESMYYNPEWPDVEGSESCNTYLVGGEMGWELLWKELARVADELGVTIQHDSRVTELVFNPDTKEVCGVKVEVGGTEKYYKANKGVLLACGGFENEPEMIAAYNQIGYPETRPMGTPYNRGDGIKMALSIGAELWHMNNFSNSGYGVITNTENPCVMSASFRLKDYIYVGADGRRFMYEECASLARHGKYLYGGSATNLMQPVPTYAIFGHQMFDAGPIVVSDAFCQWNSLVGGVLGEANDDYIDAGVFIKADTIEELAAKMGIVPEILAETVNTYNANAAQGSDPDFKRGTDVYSAFIFKYGDQSAAEIDNASRKPSIAAFNLVPIEGPFYAVRLYTMTLNTQGGPKRSAKGQIMSTGGAPIPRLFGAGELGTIYPYNYNGGGNVAEAMSSGRFAARQIAALEKLEA
jgi:succinate dehydrogenase/fumarate reductase flavoprotein subunit